MKHYQTVSFKEGVQKVFGTLDLFVSLLETEIKYPILQGDILTFWTASPENRTWVMCWNPSHYPPEGLFGALPLMNMLRTRPSLRSNPGVEKMSQ